MIAKFQIVNCEGCGDVLQVPMGSIEEGWFCVPCMDLCADDDEE